MEENIEYTENFVRTTYNPDHVIREVNEAHPSEYGWVVGDATITDLGNGQFEVSIPLTKYSVNSRGR